MNLQLHELAKHDLSQGGEFYESQEPGLGDYFFESLESDLDDLLKIHTTNDLTFTPQVLFNHFVSRSSKFPWSIYYQTQENLILVQAILDQRFSPNRLKQILTTRNPS